MSFLDRLGGVLQQYQSGSATPSREEAHAHYDQIAREVPSNVLAGSIGPALGTLEPGDVESRVARSAAQMTPEQRGGLLGTLLGGLGTGSGGGLGDLLGRIGVSPSVAQNPQQASPEDVARVAGYARQNQPDLLHRAGDFYAQHPTLVKALGTAAIVAIARNLAGKRPGLI